MNNIIFNTMFWLGIFTFDFLLIFVITSVFDLIRGLFRKKRIKKAEVGCITLDELYDKINNDIEITIDGKRLVLSINKSYIEKESK